MSVSLDVPRATDDDFALLQQARRALEWDPLVPSDRIEVSVMSGWVTLTGSVKWYDQKKRAEEDIGALIGVRGVTNALGYL